MPSVSSAVNSPSYTPPKKDPPKSEDSKPAEQAEETKAADQAPPEDSADGAKGADEGSKTEEAADSGKDEGKDLNQDPANVYGKALVNFVTQNDSDIDADSDAKDVAEEAADKAADAQDKTGKGTFLDFGVSTDQDGNKISTLALGEEGGGSSPDKEGDVSKLDPSQLEKILNVRGQDIDPKALQKMGDQFGKALSDPNLQKNMTDIQNGLTDITKGFTGELTGEDRTDAAEIAKMFGQSLTNRDTRDQIGKNITTIQNSMGNLTKGFEADLGDADKADAAKMAQMFSEALTNADNQKDIKAIQGGFTNIANTLTKNLPKSSELNADQITQTLGGSLTNDQVTQGIKTVQQGFNNMTNIFTGALDKIFTPGKGTAAADQTTAKDKEKKPAGWQLMEQADVNKAVADAKKSIKILPGETLGTIAQGLMKNDFFKGKTASQIQSKLVQANGIANPDLIIAGDTLKFQGTPRRRSTGGGGGGGGGNPGGGNSGGTTTTTVSTGSGARRRSSGGTTTTTVSTGSGTTRRSTGSGGSGGGSGFKIGKVLTAAEMGLVNPDGSFKDPSDDSQKIAQIGLRNKQRAMDKMDSLRDPATLDFSHPTDILGRPV
jgi:hypothetical protein